MALTFSEIARSRPFKGKRTVTVEITFDASYPTGGEAVVAANLKVGRIHNGMVKEVSAGTAVVAARWDNTNGKILEKISLKSLVFRFLDILCFVN